MRRSIVVLVAALAASPLTSAQGARVCAQPLVGSASLQRASVFTGAVTATIEEHGSATACADGVHEGPSSGRLVIRLGDRIVCDRAVDPAFDPFGLGAGIHDAPGEPCGADLTWIIKAAAPAPLVESAMVGYQQETTATGSIWFGSQSHPVEPRMASYSQRYRGLPVIGGG